MNAAMGLLDSMTTFMKQWMGRIKRAATPSKKPSARLNIAEVRATMHKLTQLVETYHLMMVEVRLSLLETETRRRVHGSDSAAPHLGKLRALIARATKLEAEIDADMKARNHGKIH